MTAFSEIVSLCRQLEANRGRLEKRRLVAEFLRGVAPDEVAHAVAFLTGRPFPASDPRVLSARGLPATVVRRRRRVAADASVTWPRRSPRWPRRRAPGARRMRDERLGALAARAREDEREVLARIIGGEMRTGAVRRDRARGHRGGGRRGRGRVRRAALFLGDLAAVAALARGGGAAALARRGDRGSSSRSCRCWRRSPTDFDEVLAAHGGRTALEYKYDGARVQIHSDGDARRRCGRAGSPT